MSLDRLSAEETLIAHTENAAVALGRADLGKIEVGAQADFVVVDSGSALEALYRWEDSPLGGAFIGGVPGLREAVANRSFASLGELEETVERRRVYLMNHPELLKGRTRFHWLPV